MLKQIVNFFHLLLLFIPIGIFFIPTIYTKNIGKWVLLITALIPLHWVFFDDSCVFTLVSQKMGDYQNAQTNSEFSETNLKWLYQPIMRLFGWKWNNDGLNKMVTLHWIINIILIWIFCFYFL